MIFLLQILFLCAEWLIIGLHTVAQGYFNKMLPLVGVYVQCEYITIMQVARVEWSSGQIMNENRAARELT